MSLEGSLPALYSPGGRVTSQLDLKDNQKVIIDYTNLGIICILTDLVVSLGYLSGVLQEAPRRVVPRKASSCGLRRPGGVAHVVCRGYPRSYPPQLVPERLVLVVQRRLELVRAGANKAESQTHGPTTMMSCRAVVSSCRIA